MVASVAFAVMASLAYCQSVSTDQAASLTDSTVSESGSSVPFWFPIGGLSEDAASPWGALVSTFQFESNSYKYELYEIVIADTESAIEEDTEPPPERTPSVLLEQEHPIDIYISVQVPANGDTSIILGANSDLANRVSVPYGSKLATVPFGINLGRNGSWNGSVSVGGYYDSNRISSDRWILLPGAENGISSFARNGTLEGVEAHVTSEDIRHNLLATLDFNNDAIVLPSKLRCQEAFSVTLRTTYEVITIHVPANLTPPGDRCTVREDDGTIILGRPFFQAAYTYVDVDGKVYIAAAHQYDLPIQVKVFQARAMLLPVPSPTPTTPTTPATPLPPAPISAASLRDTAHVLASTIVLLCLQFFVSAFSI